MRGGGKRFFYLPEGGAQRFFDVNEGGAGRKIEAIAKSSPEAFQSFIATSLSDQINTTSLYVE